MITPIKFHPSKQTVYFCSCDKCRVDFKADATDLREEGETEIVKYVVCIYCGNKMYDVKSVVMEVPNPKENPIPLINKPFPLSKYSLNNDTSTDFLKHAPH